MDDLPLSRSCQIKKKKKQAKNFPTVNLLTTIVYFILVVNYNFLESLTQGYNFFVIRILFILITIKNTYTLSHENYYQKFVP